MQPGGDQFLQTIWSFHDTSAIFGNLNESLVSLKGKVQQKLEHCGTIISKLKCLTDLKE